MQLEATHMYVCHCAYLEATESQFPGLHLGIRAQSEVAFLHQAWHSHLGIIISCLLPNNSMVLERIFICWALVYSVCVHTQNLEEKVESLCKSLVMAISYSICLLTTGRLDNLHCLIPQGRKH